MKNNEVDFTKTKLDFTIRHFEYEGSRAFELKVVLEAADAKSGKPRGRKPRQAPDAEYLF